MSCLISGGKLITASGIHCIVFESQTLSCEGFLESILNGPPVGTAGCIYDQNHISQPTLSDFGTQRITSHRISARFGNLRCTYYGLLKMSHEGELWCSHTKHRAHALIHRLTLILSLIYPPVNALFEQLSISFYPIS